ncbi:unnamed protein product [Linum tenue]|uniref:Serine-rich protein-like protein n=1 Tax=Linum tenue TaxID=586396 RepID=A0AAV0K2C5_9ROSI|nr:unnamed protein product [Linum tenue]
MGSNSKRSSGPVLRSLSPRGRFPSYNSAGHLSSSSSSSAFASSTSSSFYSPPSAFFRTTAPPHRSASPTRVNLYSQSPPSPTFRFSIDRSTSPNRNISVATKHTNHISSLPARKTCMCSPTSHPGSFRCSLHKNSHQNGHAGGSSFTPNRLNMRRSAMTNSLVRIGGVEGDWVKRALSALIRPSSHQQRRRADFQHRKSRLSVMSRAEAGDS